MDNINNVIVDDSYSNYTDLIERRKTEPIKRVEDINAIYQYFLDKNKHRDAALFMIGINVGLRIGDLLQLKYGQFYDRIWQPVRDIKVVEQKTSETRGEKRVTFTQKFYRQHADLSEEDMMKVIAKMVQDGKEEYTERKKRPPEERYIYANDNVFKALDVLRENAVIPPIRDNYLFRNESRNSTGKNKPIDSSSAWRAMDGACKELGIDFKIGTHGLRKTFGYHFMEAYGRSDAALQTLQRMFKHSSPVITLRYIGIEAEDFAQGYRDVGRQISTITDSHNNVVQFPLIGRSSGDVSLSMAK